MKGCFVLQRRFAYLGHEIVTILKEKHGLDQFCAYTILRDGYDFLRSQKDIAYSDIVLDEEIQKRYKTEKLDLEYLAEFEKTYGSVWRFIDVDRVIRFGQLIREYPYDKTPYTHEELLRIVQVYAKGITAFLDKERPDFIITYIPGALGMLMLYTIAKKRGIPTITIVFPMTENRITVSEQFDRLSWVDKEFQENRKRDAAEVPMYAQAKEFIETFRKQPKMYSKVYDFLIKHGKWRQFDFLLPKNIVRSIRWIYVLVRRWRNGSEKKTDFTTVHPFWYIFDRVKRKVRNFIGADDLYDEFDPDRPFVFYPLHYEPELAVLLLAPFDTDQIAIIRRVARSLPAGMFLYVKEHPQMTPYRPRRFYAAIKKIPNVKLLRPDISSFSILPRAKLVTIISGSAGWEASLFGVPVITFGDAFYNSLPSVKRSRVPEELPELIKTQLSGHTLNEDDLIRYVAALLHDSVECDLLQFWESESDQKRRIEGLTPFAQLIAGKVRSVTKK